MIKYYKPDNPDNLLTIEGDPDFVCKKCGVIAIEVEDPKDVEIAQYRREYLDTTAALCALAEEPYVGKLSNIDFKRIVFKASSNPLTGVLTAQLVYVRTVLRELNGDSWFENITGE